MCKQEVTFSDRLSNIWNWIVKKFNAAVSWVKDLLDSVACGIQATWHLFSQGEREVLKDKFLNQYDLLLEEKKDQIRLVKAS